MPLRHSRLQAPLKTAPTAPPLGQGQRQEGEAGGMENLESLAAGVMVGSGGQMGAWYLEFNSLHRQLDSPALQ